MEKVSEYITDRITQAFNILKNNFIELFLPIFIYNLVSVVIVGTVVTYMIFTNISEVINGNIDYFAILNNTYVIISIIIGIIFFTIYLILYIPILLGLIKSIDQAYKGNQITTKENLLYGFSKILKSFKTYWYIFKYIALIPSILFIIGGLIINIGFYNDANSSIYFIGGTLMLIGSIMFIIMMIYRGIKASFPIYSATISDSFTNKKFLESIKITTNNWWRIAGNFLLVGLIISFISGIFSLIFRIFSYSGIDYSALKSIDDLSSIIGSFSITTQILSGFINNIINSIASVFVIIFTYLLYLRLKYEFDGSEPVNNSEKEINNGDIVL